jgi:hypothetical protein
MDAQPRPLVRLMDGAPIGAPPPFALVRFVIASASEAIQSEVSRWIASSLSLLAMTAVLLRHARA